MQARKLQPHKCADSLVVVGETFLASQNKTLKTFRCTVCVKEFEIIADQKPRKGYWRFCVVCGEKHFSTNASYCKACKAKYNRNWYEESTSKTNHLMVRVPKDLHKQLDAYAKKKKTTKTKVIQEAIKAFLE